jgi:hypothetical protein
MGLGTPFRIALIANWYSASAIAAITAFFDPVSK